MDRPQSRFLEPAPSAESRQESRASEQRDDSSIELVLPLRDNWQLEQIPEPELTPEEDQLPPSERLCRVIVKKCQLANCYNFYSVEFLWNLLTPPVLEITGNYGNAVASHIIGPEEFYLNWVSDLDKIQLLRTWVTAEIEDDDMEEPDQPDTRNLVGSIVCAYLGSTTFYHRATVLKLVANDKKATVFLIDDGMTTTIPINKLRPIPHPLALLPGYAIRCKLALCQFTEDNLSDMNTRKEFIWELKQSKSFKCKFTEYCEDTNTFSAKIKVVEGVPAPRDLNLVVQGKYKARQRVIQTLEDQNKRDMESTVIHRNSEVEITNFSTFRMKGLRIFRITDAVSPSDFGIEYVVDYAAPPGRTIWQSEMQTFYNNSTRLLTHKLSTCRPLVSRCYVIQTPAYGWQRCRIITRHDALNTCDILMLDLGSVCRKVSFSALHEIDPQFTQMCALGFRGYLGHIIPAGGALAWSPHVCSAFERMVVGKIFYAISIERQDAPSNSKFPQIESRLGLIMAEKCLLYGNRFDDTPPNVVLNAQLCALNLAEPDGIAGQIPFSINPNEEGVFDFQTMRNALTQQNPSLDVRELIYDSKDDIPHTTNVKSSASTLGSISGASSVSSEPPEDPRMKHYKYFNVGANSLPVPKNMTQIPTEIRKAMASCVVSYASSPSCFYVQMVERMPKLKQMMRYIAEQLHTQQELSLKDIVPGLEVAVYLFDETSKPTWFRGIVRVVIKSIQLCKVILVDYGNEVSVKIGALRRLPDYYCQIPGYAQRVHLDVPNLIPSGGMPMTPQWSTQAGETFRKYLYLWQPENPLYYIWRPPGSVAIELDSYGQDIEYNIAAMFWTKHSPTILPTTEADLLPPPVNPSRPMARKLFRTIGVDLVYEVATDESSPYKFEKAWDVLVKKGLAHMG